MLALGRIGYVCGCGAYLRGVTLSWQTLASTGGNSRGYFLPACEAIDVVRRASVLRADVSEHGAALTTCLLVPKDGGLGSPLYEVAMADYKFKIGRLVYFRPGSPLPSSRELYKVIKQLPAAKGRFEYLIRSEDGRHERVVRENELRSAT